MLSDSYVEQVVKTKSGTGYYIGTFCGIFLMVLGVFSIIFIRMIGIIIALMGFFIFKHFLEEKKTEYEYIITNGNVEISAIYGAVRRKLLKQINVNQISMMVPGNSERISRDQFGKIYDYTSKSKDHDSVALVVDVDNKKDCVFLELNEKCIEHMKLYLKFKYYDL